jgi:(E)-4-hydroxy-3-methylbut-2-enyl-diphosphate synthase
MGGFDRGTIKGKPHCVKAVFIGGGSPVLIQTMWKDRFTGADLEGDTGDELCSRIKRLQEMGCGILRFAVPDMEAAEVLGRLAEMVSMPLVADIHFDYKIALRCLDFPIAKIRINPGNIGRRENVEKVLAKAGAKYVPVRIGVNSGSLPQDLRRKIADGEIDRVEALLQAAMRELAVFEEFRFNAVLASVKASSVADTLRANRLLAERTDIPLHIGVTEAGPLVAGTVRNTVALYNLLCEGIGDTLRVSLSDTVENEVIAAREIVNVVAEAGTEARAVPQHGIHIVSCPKCGRNSFDTHAFTEKWLPILYSLQKSATIAIMGCAVNGPGEARDADLGITGAGNKVLLFRYGKIIKTIDTKDADTAFEDALRMI